MDSCWWWRVDKTELVKEGGPGQLFKVEVATTSADYAEQDVDKNGYPDFPAKNARWEKGGEAFMFCSKTRPAYIEYNLKDKTFMADNPFDEKGVTSGATEGVGNLYAYVCHVEQPPVLDMPPERAFFSVVLQKPTDIFNYPIK
ncbi:MAG: hypothetical protein PHU14_09855 [Methylovulum sp.]|nr:hypothetical protein [Methylovulum sp.]